MNRADRLVLVLAALAAVTAGCAAGAPDPQAARVSRQAEVAGRGASVMPFDLDRTTHTFTKNGSGGVQSVTADDPGDAAHVALVRQHLDREAGLFARGDFTDPARIHGDAMPGPATLRAAAGRVTAAYADTAGGATITYTTSDAGLVAALHAWFDAQVDDHGSHASHG